MKNFETNPQNTNETEQTEAKEQFENQENIQESSEDINARVNSAQEELAGAHKLVERIGGQKGKLAQLREKIGLAGGSYDNINKDYENAQQQLEAAKQKFRSTFGEYGKQLAHEKFGNEEPLSNEQVLDILYSEKLIETDQVDENGERISRTLAEDYEARLNSLQEKTPTQKGIISKMVEKYSNIPKHKKLVMSTMLAAGMGAATGGASVALAAGANKLTKIMLSGAASAGADALLKKHMDRRDRKNQTTDADFMQRAEGVAQSSFEEAKNTDGSVEKGILEGTEKKMQVFEEMFKHQKAKNTVRMVAAVAVGGAVGGGFFDADAAHASTGIKAGSFNFGGGSAMHAATETASMPDIPVNTHDMPPTSSAMPEIPTSSGEMSPTSNIAENASRATFDNDDWGEASSMKEALKRPAGIIPGEDGRTLERNIGSFDSNEPVGRGNIESDDWSNVKSFGGSAEQMQDISEAEASSEQVTASAVEQNVNEATPLNQNDMEATQVVHASNNVETKSDFTEGFLPIEIKNLENANAGLVIMKHGNDPVLNNIKVQIGLPKNENMLQYLDRFAQDAQHDLTFQQKKHIADLVKFSV